MQRGLILGVFVIVSLFAWASAAGAQAPVKRNPAHRHASLTRSYIRSLGPHGRIVYANRAHRLGRGHGTGYADLVGDPDSGLGFYPLPIRYRIGAWRYRVMHPRPPWDNPVIYAIAADAARYDYWTPVADQGYRYGVFNPYDGVGTPFFGGYYGPAGDDDEPPPAPFGRPYRH